MSRLLCLLVLLLSSTSALLAAEAPAAREDKPASPTTPQLRLLLLTGANNHDWRATTPKLKQILEDSGRFSVDITEHPEQMTGVALEPYDVLLSNWNAFNGRERAADWSDEARQALIDFVKKHHKGAVWVHAGSSSFYDWAEYHELALATWKLGQTGHGRNHAFEVRIEPVEHPITRGVTNFQTFDELWNRPGLQPGITVLASSFSAGGRGGADTWESTAMIKEFDGGRSFTLLLGHAAKYMDNPGFQSLLTRGAEWAATGNVTLEATNRKDSQP